MGRLRKIGLGLSIALPFLLPMVLPAAEAAVDVAVAAEERNAFRAASALTRAGEREAVGASTDLARPSGSLKVGGGGGASTGLARPSGSLKVDGGGGAVGLKRTREDVLHDIRVLQDFRTLAPEKRTELLEGMPDDLRKLHGNLCKVAPGHFEGIPLKYATDLDRLAVSISTKRPNQKFWGVYNTYQKVITIDRAYMETTGTYNTQEIVFHEAAHVMEDSLGRDSITHTPLFKKSHEVLWLRAYGHELMSREELESSAERTNAFIQRDLERIDVRRQQGGLGRATDQLDKHFEDRSNMRLDVRPYLTREDGEDEPLLRARLRTLPFPAPVPAVAAAAAASI